MKSWTRSGSALRISPARALVPVSRASGPDREAHLHGAIRQAIRLGVDSAGAVQIAAGNSLGPEALAVPRSGVDGDRDHDVPQHRGSRGPDRLLEALLGPRQAPADPGVRCFLVVRDERQVSLVLDALGLVRHV